MSRIDRMSIWNSVWVRNAQTELDRVAKGVVANERGIGIGEPNVARSVGDGCSWWPALARFRLRWTNASRFGDLAIGGVREA